MNTFSNRVLHWLESMRVGLGRYRMSASSDSSLFTSCFALYIYDLLGETRSWSSEKKGHWIDLINASQDADSGYFLPEWNAVPLDGKPVHQLTSFCLSALELLGGEPRYGLRFLSTWQNKKDIHDYLLAKGCADGVRGSGNAAMFVAIFLTYHYEKTGESHSLDLLDAWFDFHDEHQNSSGFWGRDRSSHHFHGVQNGFHQLLVYFYWNRDVARSEHIVDAVLAIQDCDGFYSPTPGGDGCHDLDSISVLTNITSTTEHRPAEVKRSLMNAHLALLGTQQDDGGFCQSKMMPTNLMRLARFLPRLARPVPLHVSYYRLRKSIGIAIRGQKTTPTTNWTTIPRAWTDSNLWDTWFRCLGIALIENALDLDQNASLFTPHFQSFVGLGFHEQRNVTASAPRGGAIPFL